MAMDSPSRVGVMRLTAGSLPSARWSRSLSESAIMRTWVKPSFLIASSVLAALAPFVLNLFLPVGIQRAYPAAGDVLLSNSVQKYVPAEDFPGGAARVFEMG